MVKTSKWLVGWIGDSSWSENPLAVVREDGRQFGLLFDSKKDAIAAGWEKPKKVEIKVRLL